MAAGIPLLCSLLWVVCAAVEGKEFTVTCLASGECVLPCRFQSDGRGARVMWYKRKAVVSCTRYGNTSFVVGHNSPADKYKGRTGLYAERVLEGNATLVLRDVAPNDEGKYFCVTMTAPRTDESGVISLVVRAPVREVDMGFSGGAVTCAARGVFPAPTLAWSTDPPTAAPLLQSRTSAVRDTRGFYDVHSSLLRRPANATATATANHTFVCCVRSDASTRTAYLKYEAPVSTSAGSDVTIACSLPGALPDSFNLTWRFGRSEPIASTVATARGSEVKVWERWRPRVFDSFAARRGLRLHGLRAEHQGTYTCEVSTPERTYVTWTDVTVTEECKQQVYILVIVALTYLLCLSYVTLAFFGIKIKGLQRAGRQEDKEEEEVEEEEETQESLSVDEVNTDGGGVKQQAT